MEIRYYTYPELQNLKSERRLNVEGVMRSYMQFRNWCKSCGGMSSMFILFNDKAGRHINWNTLFWLFSTFSNLSDALNAEREMGKPLEQWTDEEIHERITRFFGREPFLRNLPDGSLVDTSRR